MGAVLEGVPPQSTSYPARRLWKSVSTSEHCQAWPCETCRLGVLTISSGQAVQVVVPYVFAGQKQALEVVAPAPAVVRLPPHGVHTVALPSRQLPAGHAHSDTAAAPARPRTRSAAAGFSRLSEAGQLEAVANDKNPKPTLRLFLKELTGRDASGALAAPSCASADLKDAILKALQGPCKPKGGV